MLLAALRSSLSVGKESFSMKVSHNMLQDIASVLIDAAHFIRNGNSQMARAICELDSIYRWAVTGTPIQNRLSDLASLLKFIRVYPYNDSKCFDNDISRLWKSGEDDEAVKRLKWLSACLLLRRPKGTINIPSRRDVKCAVDFSAAERAVYDKVLQQTITRIYDALLQNSEVSRSGVYINVLQQIESLRLVCDLGLHYDTRHSKAAAISTTEAIEWSLVTQQTFNV
jgi:SNF2 family DNA or RNA helicase